MWKRFMQLVATILAVCFGGVVIVQASLPITWSREFLWEPLHWVVLLTYTILLGYLLSWVATERQRKTKQREILEWFGPHGLVLLPSFLLFVSAVVFGSWTAILSNYDWVMVKAAGAAEVTDGSLCDFYLWHFLELVPLVDLNETLKWEAPIHYTQTRVGVLVLLFQAFVVIPSIGAIRSFWRQGVEVRSADEASQQIPQHSDANLHQLVELWPSLSEGIKQRIMALAQA